MTQMPDVSRAHYSPGGRCGGRGGWVSRGRGDYAYPTDRRGVYEIMQDEDDGATEENGEREELSVRNELEEEKKA